MGKNTIFWVLLGTLVLAAGCGSHDSKEMVNPYSQTQQVQVVFQKSRIPASCRLFSQLFVTLPAHSSGQEMAEVINTEAKSKGADMVLIGQSRQCTSESDLSFTCYGPDREYSIGDWPGWDFGYDDWQDQGEWIGIGYNEWGNPDVRFDYPVMLQVAFVRCQP